MAPVQVVAFMSYVWDNFKWSIAWGMDRTGSSGLVHELCVGPVQLIDLMLHVPTLLNRSGFGGSTACAGRLKSSVQQVRHIEHVRDRLNRSTSDGMRETSLTGAAHKACARPVEPADVRRHARDLFDEGIFIRTCTA